ncbi:hypothetical protein Pmani_027606 [Petrolisthes manimaculis]|uniref:Uncharacterized protein n=1 Tax=Petrolisthes manimaculis TaxID=1843537 RepID=A0AAE1P1S3_9EUCA|nr:hypothetical protein Pmani_027606 [Petrolisthes manimaculis]
MNCSALFITLLTSPLASPLATTPAIDTTHPVDITLGFTCDYNPWKTSYNNNDVSMELCVVASHRFWNTCGSFPELQTPTSLVTTNTTT